jgi:hypothetical protein
MKVAEPRLPFAQPVEPFDPVQAHAVTRARTADPETSHEAAEAIADRLRELQQRVLDVFHAYGPLTHHRLIALYQSKHGRTAESTIRTRCAELTAMGLLRDSGRREKVSATRDGIVWERVS